MTRYLSCAETAKLVRKALHEAFPGVKFSVRSSVYSGGASIDVSYTGGPSQNDVEPIAKQYAGGGFDGMIDMAYNRSHWLSEDGSTIVADDPGTERSMGVYPAEHNPAPAQAEKVQFGADFIFVNRHLTPDEIDAARAWMDRATFDGEKLAGRPAYIAERLAYAKTQYPDWDYDQCWLRIR